MGEVAPIWQRPLESLSRAEWEALCDGCGKCCLHKLEDEDTGDRVKYQIVGEDEANVKQNRISVTSPIARALIGKECGDVVVVKVPSGDIEYEIDDIKHI